MEQQKIEIFGVIKSEIKRECNPCLEGIQGYIFDIDSGEHIYCIRVVPAILKGWKVKILGKWSEDGETFITDYVEPIIDKEKLKNKQLKEFEK